MAKATIEPIPIPHRGLATSAIHPTTIEPMGEVPMMTVW